MPRSYDHVADSSEQPAFSLDVFDAFATLPIDRMSCINALSFIRPEETSYSEGRSMRPIIAAGSFSARWGVFKLIVTALKIAAEITARGSKGSRRSDCYEIFVT